MMVALTMDRGTQKTVGFDNSLWFSCNLKELMIKLKIVTIDKFQECMK